MSTRLDALAFIFSGEGPIPRRSGTGHKPRHGTQGRWLATQGLLEMPEGGQLGVTKMGESDTGGVHCAAGPGMVTLQPLHFRPWLQMPRSTVRIRQLDALFLALILFFHNKKILGAMPRGSENRLQCCVLVFECCKDSCLALPPAPPREPSIFFASRSFAIVPGATAMI